MELWLTGLPQRHLRNARSQSEVKGLVQERLNLGPNQLFGHPKLRNNFAA